MLGWIGRERGRSRPHLTVERCAGVVLISPLAPLSPIAEDVLIERLFTDFPELPSAELEMNHFLV